MLDSKLAGLAKEPDEEWFLALVEPQLRKCKAMTPEFVPYERADDEAPERSLRFLYERAHVRGTPTEAGTRL